MRIKIPLPPRKYSIYKQKRALMKCEMCDKYKFCYELSDWEADEEGHPTYAGSYWSCKRCMPNETYEYYFL